MQIRIYYEDTDCGGIVYHTNYIKYCERARSEVFFRVGELPSSGTCGFVVSALEAKFLGFARLGDVLWVQTQMRKLGRVQILLRQRIYVLPTQTNRPQGLNDLPNLQNLASPQPKDFGESLGQTLMQERCVFDVLVRMGYVDVATQNPAQIPQKFIDLLALLPRDS